MTKEESFKNYYSNVERKFTILHLEIRKLDTLDIISLVLFSISILIDILGIWEIKHKVLFSFSISWIIAFLILTTPFGIRFRNIYFSILWLILSLLFLVNNTSLNKLPILLFFLYHIIRLIFWNNHHKEFIPYNVLRGEFNRYVSKIEGRGGYKEDRRYMKIMLFIGFIIIMYYFSEMISQKY